MRTREPELWKGLLAGAVAGLAATWVMTQFQNGWNKVRGQSQSSNSTSGQDQQQSEDATMKTAGAIAGTIFRTDLSHERKQKLSPFVHYGFGTLMGAIYGGMHERFENMSLGWGSAFGSVLFLGADETAIPLLGLGPGPTETPLSTHLYAWASHLVYGATLESLRRPVRHAMGYDDLESRMRGIAIDIRGGLKRYAGEARRQTRPYVKTALRNVEKSARKMRRAA